MLAAVNGIQLCSVFAPTCTNFVGHRFSPIRSCIPTRIANQPYTTAGIASAGSASLAARAQRRGAAFEAPAGDRKRRQRARRHGGEFRPREAHQPGGHPGQHEPLAGQREQHRQQAQQPDRAGVGVRQHEVEGGAREADRQQHGARQPGAQRRQPLPCERVEDGDDRGRLHQPERERGR